jgi:hypothetical protein
VEAVAMGASGGGNGLLRRIAEPGTIPAGFGNGVSDAATEKDEIQKSL